MSQHAAKYQIFSEEGLAKNPWRSVKPVRPSLSQQKNTSQSLDDAAKKTTCEATFFW